MDSTGELPPPRPGSKLSKAIVGFAMCFCVSTVALGVAWGSLCGPQGAFGYGGGSSTGAAYLLIGLVMAVVAGVGALVFGVKVVSELTQRYAGESGVRGLLLGVGTVIAFVVAAGLALRVAMLIGQGFKVSGGN